MTVSSTINREQYATDGVTTAFTIHFPFFDDTDVNAVFVSSTGVSTTFALNTDFTVSGGADASGVPGGGTLTCSVAPATGGMLTIYREIPQTQESDYVEDDPLPADQMEADFDRSVMRDQQLKDGQDRALTFPVTIPAGVSAELPTPSAGAYLGWNDGADALENKTLSALGVLVKGTTGQAVAGSNDTDYMTALTVKAALQGATYDTGQTSTDATAAEGPVDEQYRNSATPAAADLGGVRSWAMKSSTGVKRVVAKVLSRLVTATNAAEDAALDFYTIIAGTLARRFSIGAGFYANGLTDQGAGTVNATALYVNGVVTSGAAVTFSANKNSVDQTGITSATYTKLTADTEDWDVGGYYDAPNSKFTPPAGKYIVDAGALFTANVVDQSLYRVAIYKNGTIFRSSGESASGTTSLVQISVVVTANGTDYFEAYVYGAGAGAKTVSGDPTGTYFQAAKVA